MINVMPELTRRAMVGAVAASPLAKGAAMKQVVVVGAGAFGGWTALHLLRMGANVTLVDQWGPGNARASSGGETRIIRGTYGDRVYTEMVARSLILWKENEKRWNTKLFFNCGVIHMQGANDVRGKQALGFLKDAGIPGEALSPADAAKKFPQVSTVGVNWVLYEPHGGMLRARRGCEAVLAAFEAEGGAYRTAKASLDGSAVALSDGTKLAGDAVVLACGPWLSKMGLPVSPSRQEAFFFGTPAGETMWHESRMPCWIDSSSGGNAFYGTPGNDWRGFKVANDLRGDAFDPDTGHRVVSEKAMREAREYMERRFPKLKGAPVVETRVCQYENTADHNLILDRHPSSKNVWIAGGGSGHGYKMGPAVGEHMAQLVMDKKQPDAFFGIARLKKG